MLEQLGGEHRSVSQRHFQRFAACDQFVNCILRAFLCGTGRARRDGRQNIFDALRLGQSHTQSSDERLPFFQIPARLGRDFEKPLLFARHNFTVLGIGRCLLGCRERLHRCFHNASPHLKMRSEFRNFSYQFFCTSKRWICSHELHVRFRHAQSA